MNIDQILNRIIRTSMRTELEAELELLLYHLNDYKLYLQRDKRIVFSQTPNVPIVGLINTRILPLPYDFLFPIALKRGGVSNTTEYTKDLVLTRWMNKEEFDAAFPLTNLSGGLNTGAVNTYIYLGDNIILGPTLPETETFYLDYYRLLPEYTLSIGMVDDFTYYYQDGLHLAGMKWIFEEWVPDAKLADRYASRLEKAEIGIKKFVVNREEPMESTLELPTSQ